MRKQKRKDPIASAMAKKRWRKTSKASRTAQMRAIANIRWNEERKEKEEPKTHAAA